MSDLTGKTAVIIGASGTQSFGVASAKRLAAAGAKVVVSARRKEQLEALAAEINGVAISCDISDEAQVKALFENAKPRLDAWISPLTVPVNSPRPLSAC